MNSDANILDQSENVSNESSTSVSENRQQAEDSLLKDIEKDIEELLERQKKWITWFIFARILLKMIKIIAALGSGIAAVITALTQSPTAAIITAIAGVLTTLLTLLESEFRVEKKRRHHTFYMLKFDQLLFDLLFEQNLSYEDLRTYREEFYRLRIAERRDNFSIEDEEGLQGANYPKLRP